MENGIGFRAEVNHAGYKAVTPQPKSYTMSVVTLEFYLAREVTVMDGHRPARRDVLRLAALSAVQSMARLEPGRSSAAAWARNSTSALRAEIGDATRYPESHGDLWTATWADDSNLYAASDDTQGFDKACSSNLAISRIVGNMPPEIHGVTINPMKAFGGWGEIRREDGAMWKACGLTSVEGVLYLSVSRHLNPDYHPWIQQTWDATIIKSTDHGRTWSPPPQLNRAMFPGRTFSTPFFVQYGKDGQGAKDGPDQFVYAVSNDGAWNNGNWMTLGRVRRDRIGRLDSQDWEFVHGYDGKGGVIWQPRSDSAVQTFYNPGRTSMTGIHYIAPLDLYILPQWYYTHLDQEARRWKATCLEFYHAPAPWGPWTLFHAQNFEPQGWYNPCIPGKFISSDGRNFWIFVAGDWTTADTARGLYGLWMMPVGLKVEG